MDAKDITPGDFVVCAHGGVCRVVTDADNRCMIRRAAGIGQGFVTEPVTLHACVKMRLSAGSYVLANNDLAKVVSHEMDSKMVTISTDRGEATLPSTCIDALETQLLYALVDGNDKLIGIGCPADLHMSLAWGEELCPRDVPIELWRASRATKDVLVGGNVMATVVKCTAGESSDGWFLVMPWASREHHDSPYTLRVRKRANAALAVTTALGVTWN